MDQSPHEDASDRHLLLVNGDDRSAQDGDSAAPSPETQTQSPYSIVQEGLIVIPLRSIFLCLYVIFQAAKIVTASTVLIVSWGQECDVALNIYLLVHATLSAMSVATNIQGWFIFLRNPQRLDAFRWLEWSVDVIWLSWFIVGNALIYTSKACPETTPPLFYTSAVLIAMGYIWLFFKTFKLLASMTLAYFRTAVELHRHREVSERLIRSLKTKISPGNETDSCTICLSDYKEGDSVSSLTCGHQFHVECIRAWLEKSTHCPVCRKDHAPREHDADVEDQQT